MNQKENPNTLYLVSICQEVNFEKYNVVDNDIFVSVENLERFTDGHTIDNRCWEY